MTGVEVIAAERQRQMEVEQLYPEGDVFYNNHDQLSNAAAAYAIRNNWELRRQLWPWSPDAFKPARYPDDGDGYWTKANIDARVHELAKAGALIAAEIDRLSTVKLGTK